MYIFSNFQKPVISNNYPKPQTFKGHFGDKIVREIIQNKEVNASQVVNRAKTFWMFDKNKVLDIFDSMLNHINDLRSEIQFKNREIKELKKIIKIKEKEVEKLSKYAAMDNVHSIEALEVNSPEHVVNLIDRIAASKNEATKSMSDFIFTGKNFSKAKRQMERIFQMVQAEENGLLEIPVVKNKIQQAIKDKTLSKSGDIRFTVFEMIYNGITKHPQGSAVKQPVLRKNMEDNIMTLLKQVFPKENKFGITDFTLEIDMNKTFNRLLSYYENIK